MGSGSLPLNASCQKSMWGCPERFHLFYPEAPSGLLLELVLQARSYEGNVWPALGIEQESE